MPLRVEMRILEPARIFQSKPKHPIKTNVRNPNQRQQQLQMFASEKSVPAQHQRADGRVDSVVRHCADTSVDAVADHGKIRHEKKQKEQKPTAVIPLIGDEAGDKDGGTFQVEKWLWVHGLPFIR
jgi:hypothetical protein